MPLNLPDFNVLEVKYNDTEEKCIVLETLADPTGCPKCRHMFPNLYRHGTEKQFFFDTPSEGMRTVLKIHRKRFKCLECGGTFFEPLTIIHDDHDMTKRLAAYIIKECERDKFTDVSRRTGPTEKTIRNVYRSHVEMIRRGYKFETPEILGIDEIYIRTARAVMTNLKERTIIDMLPTRERGQVTEFLLSLDRNAVKLVSIDMWPAYREACNIALPKAEIVVDRFHVQKMGNEIMTRIRIDALASLTLVQRRPIKKAKYILQSRNFNLTDYEQDSLIEWCELCPILADGYEVKERYMDIWEAPDRRTAEALYDEWQRNIPASVKPYFRRIIRDFKVWRTEIFNWWDHRITNAFTESLNGKIRELHRAGRGYSFDVLRARIISKASLHKVKSIPPKFNKDSFARMIAFQEPETTNYGIDISTLLHLTDLDSD